MQFSDGAQMSGDLFVSYVIIETDLWFVRTRAEKAYKLSRGYYVYARL